MSACNEVIVEPSPVDALSHANAKPKVIATQDVLDFGGGDAECLTDVLDAVHGPIVLVKCYLAIVGHHH